MKRRIISLTLALALVFGLSITASAYTDKQMRAADALNRLDLFHGRSSAGKDYALGSTLNRAEGTLMVIRLLGKEEEAYTRDLANTPFPDVADFWNGEAPFIAYAYEEGLMKGVTTYANGVTTLTFNPRGPMNDQMFLTLILRVLGYQDGENNYIWNNAWQLAYDAGLVDSTAKDAEFTRGDAVQVAWKAMGIKLQGSTKTLAQKLMGEGLFTAVEYAEAKEIWKSGSIQDDDAGYIPSTPAVPSMPTTPTTPTTPTIPDFGEDNTGSTTPDDNTGTTTPDSGTGDSSSTTPDSGDLGSDNSPIVQPEENGGKRPADYTWEEFIAMDELEKSEFIQSFESKEAFEKWSDANREEPVLEDVELPWENGGKQPVDYTLEEYATLTDDLKQAFEAWFDGKEAFNAWMESKAEEPDLDVDDLFAGMELEDFTLDDYIALDIVDATAFRNKYFDSDEAFLEWMDSQVEMPNLDEL